jgi:hypothetical protein
MADRANLNDTIEGSGEFVPISSARPNLTDARLVLSLLEADQVVAAKSQAHFGRRTLSPGIRLMLWALRGYVVLMMIIVVVSVIGALHGAR